MWFRFTKDFDFRPEAKGGRVTIAYKAGMTQNITREAAEAAQAFGAGEPTEGEAPSSVAMKQGDEVRTARRAKKADGESS